MSSTNPLAAASNALSKTKAARNALSEANDFTRSVEGPAKAAAPKSASVDQKRTSAPAKMSGLDKDISDVASGIKWRMDQAKALGSQDRPSTFHEGGKIKKDGVQVIDAQKGETVLPKNDKKRAKELAMKHLDGMSAGMEDKAKKEKVEKKSEPKHESKHGAKRSGKHPVKHMHITVNDDKTFSMLHKHAPDAEGVTAPDTTHSAPDMDGLMDHMQANLGTPNPGEAEADAGSEAGAGAGAAPVAA